MEDPGPESRVSRATIKGSICLSNFVFPARGTYKRDTRGSFLTPFFPPPMISSQNFCSDGGFEDEAYILLS